MCVNGPVERFIPPSIRDFGVQIHRDCFVQRIQLWRSFIQTERGSNAFHGRPARLKLRTAVAMKWNYSMGIVDVAHRLMMAATLPT